MQKLLWHSGQKALREKHLSVPLLDVDNSRGYIPDNFKNKSMSHCYNGRDCCEKCGVRRTYLSQVSRYLYELPTGQRTLREPYCEGEEHSWKRRAVEVVIFLLILGAMYWSGKRLNEWRTQQEIEQNHSHITPETANDTL